MRLLQVIPSLPKGGAERMVIELANDLVSNGQKVSLLLHSAVDTSLNQHSLDSRVELIFVTKHAKNRFYKYAGLPFWVIKNRKQLLEFDVVHCHLTYGLVFGYFLAKIRKSLPPNRKLRLIATCHLVGVSVPKKTRALNKYLAKVFDYFVLVSIDSYWRSAIYYSKRDNFRVIPNGISKEPWKGISKRIEKRENFVIGTISRLAKERNPKIFIEVFEEINVLTNGKTSFILGGEGSERESIMKLVNSSSIKDKLLMPGLVLDPGQIFSSLDCYLGLNVENITGVATLEAIFSGVPAVCLQLSSDYSNGANDWIFSDQSPHKVATKIASILGVHQQLNSIHAKQIEYASNKFEIAQMRNSYLVLYNTEPEVAS